NDDQHQTYDDLAGKSDAERIEHHDRQHDNTGRQVHGQAGNNLLGITRKDERHDAYTDDALPDVATAGDKGQPVILECSCPDEGAAMSWDIDAELRATDSRRPTDETAGDHG